MTNPPTLNSFFARSLVVSLPERTDRRRDTARSLGRHGVTVGPGEVEFLDAVRPADRGEFPTIGAHGCYLSHMVGLKRARDEGWVNVLMMEDDVHPMACFGSAGPALLQQLNEREWDVALLGWIDPADHRIARYDGEPHWEPVESQTIGTHAYAVNGPAIGRLIELLEAFGEGDRKNESGGRWHIDEMLWMLGQERKLTVLKAWPVLFGQRSSRSDVVGEQALHDRLPVVRTIVDWLRRARNMRRG